MLDSSWGDLFRPFRPHFRTLLWNCVICVALGIALALVLPRRYTAKATILPPTEEQTGLSMSSLLRGLSIPGVRVPLTVTPSDMVQSVLDSDRIRAAVAREIDPRQVYGIRDSLDALVKLQKQTHVHVTPLGVVEVAVVAPRADQAAALANAYVTELDRFTRTQRMSRGHRTRVFIESRLVDIRAQIDSLQNKLSSLQTTHHITALNPALSSNVESAARLFGERMDAQFQLDLARTYASNNSQEVLVQQERLAALDKELDRLPPLGMEAATMTRDLKACEQAFAFLTAQYEDARIEEARDVLTVEVLDPATPPRRASFPRKRIFALGALGISLLGGVGWVLAGAPGSRAGLLSKPAPITG